MKKISRILFLNQMAGPLFRELAIDLSEICLEDSILYTGHPDTLKKALNDNHKLKITSAASYNTKSNLSRLWSWSVYSFFAWLKVILAPRGTLIFLVSNPPLLAPLVYITCKIKKLPYIVLIYDMHPDTLVNFGVLSNGSNLVRIWRYLNRLVWENSAAVFTIGNVMADKLSTQFNYKKTQLGYIGVVPAWADTDKIKPIKKTKNPLAQEYRQENCTTILYSGNMGKSHDITSILGAAKLLRANNKIKFLFFGAGDEWLPAFEFVSNENLENVQILPFQPESKLPYTMALGDISIVSLDKGAEGLMVPSKMYYYMAAGSAIIGICEGKNDVQDTIKLADCGKVVSPESEHALAKTILHLSSDLKELERLKVNARNASTSFFSRKSCTEKFRAFILSLNFE